MLLKRRVLRSGMSERVLAPELTTWRDPERDVRILVQEWVVTQVIDDQFISYPRSLSMIRNYVSRVGIRSVLRKVKSRRAEKERNHKIFGIGIGLVDEAPPAYKNLQNEPVVFFAPNHNPSHSFVTVPVEFVCLSPEKDSDSISDSNQSFEMPAFLAELRGWTSFSGLHVEPSSIRAALQPLTQRVASSPVGASRDLPSALEHWTRTPALTSKPTAVLFGLGNYAKTMIIPNITDSLALQRIHEIDPDQLTFANGLPGVTLDTSPYPRDDTKFDAWFIAGFHHHHARIAAAALQQGAYAVIEKPLATSTIDLENFTAAIQRASEPKFFLCFQKRYSRFNDFMQRDLPGCREEPVDMHSIVFEIPLPKLHWYNWPNSGSRLSSNGCHWIDYFLHVNGYSPVVEFDVWQPKGKDAVVVALLENSASFSMTITDTGSTRFGVREHLEFRRGNTTISIVDGSRYVAENSRSVIRKAKAHPYEAHKRMYATIAQAIAEGQLGDDARTLESTRLTLMLEDMLQTKLRIR